MGGFIIFLAVLAFSGGLVSLVWAILTYVEGKSEAQMKYRTYDNTYGLIFGYVYELGYRVGENRKQKPSNLSQNKTRFNR